MTRLSKLTFQYGGLAGLSSNADLTEPTVGEYTVSFDSKGNVAAPTGLDQKPHTIIEYEILSESGNECTLSTGVLTDNLSGKTSLRRSPIAKSASPMVTKKVGRFYSPIGGPILVGTGSFKGAVKIKFRNVYKSPGINLRISQTSQVWDSGTFTNTKARYITLICDVVFFIIEMNTVKDFTARNLEELCIVHDHILKSFGNYVKSDVMQRERYQIVYDVQPAYGFAHAGQPIVCSLSWSNNLMGLPNYYFRKTDKAPYWGMLHETGHMFQSLSWDFGVFAETTNNVLVLMFIEKFFGNTWDDHNMATEMYRIDRLSWRLNGFNNGTEDLWAGAHLHYHLTPSFGWALFGNVYQRYAAEPSKDVSYDRFLRYLADETGYNFAPYSYFFRFGFLSPDIKAIYQELSHLPTYKPYDLLLDSATPGWTETKNFFGFDNDVQVTKILPFKFDPILNFNITRPPGPIIE